MRGEAHANITKQNKTVNYAIIIFYGFYLFDLCSAFGLPRCCFVSEFHSDNDLGSWAMWLFLLYCVWITCFVAVERILLVCSICSRGSYFVLFPILEYFDVWASKGIIYNCIAFIFAFFVFFCFGFSSSFFIIELKFRIPNFSENSEGIEYSWPFFLIFISLAMCLTWQNSNF